MEKSFGVFLLTVAITCKSQTHQLEKLWETDTVVAIPESVLHDASRGILYVSLINGKGWEADGKGGIGKLTPDGHKYDSLWITGLNSPMGLAMFGDRLYAANINEVVVVNLQKGKIENRITIDNAKGLNDITVDSKGVLFVADSRSAKIWKIEHDHPTLYLDSMKGVNGLKAIGNDLYIGAGKNFLKADKNKTLTTIAQLPQGIDGIEPVGNGDFLVTGWSGYIFYVTAAGNIETILEVHAEKMNTADIGFDPIKKIIYVPTYNAKKIVAYRLK